MADGTRKWTDSCHDTRVQVGNVTVDTYIVQRLHVRDWFCDKTGCVHLVPFCCKSLQSFHPVVVGLHTTGTTAV